MAGPAVAAVAAALGGLAWMLPAGCGTFGGDQVAKGPPDGTPLTIPQGRVWLCADCHVNRTAPPKFDSEITKKDEFFCPKCSDAAAKVKTGKPVVPGTTPGGTTPPPDKLKLPGTTDPGAMPKGA